MYLAIAHTVAEFLGEELIIQDKIRLIVYPLFPLSQGLLPGFLCEAGLMPPEHGKHPLSRMTGCIPSDDLANATPRRTYNTQVTEPRAPPCRAGTPSLMNF